MEIENIARHTFEAEISSAEIVEKEPPPDVMAEVRRYYELLLIDYTRRTTEIETFLGFAADSEALGSRLAKIENFLGVK